MILSDFPGSSNKINDTQSKSKKGLFSSEFVEAPGDSWLDARQDGMAVGHHKRDTVHSGKKAEKQQSSAIVRKQAASSSSSSDSYFIQCTHRWDR